MKLDGMLLTDTADQECVEMFLVMIVQVNNFIRTLVGKFCFDSSTHRYLLRLAAPTRSYKGNEAMRVGGNALIHCFPFGTK